MSDGGQLSLCVTLTTTQSPFFWFLRGETEVHRIEVTCQPTGRLFIHHVLQGRRREKDVALGPAGFWRERALAWNLSFAKGKSHSSSGPQFPYLEVGPAPHCRAVVRIR